MAHSSNMDSSIEEEDPRSLKIRKGCKPLKKYLKVLNDSERYFPQEDIEIFDDFFLSFLKEEDFKTCTKALKLLFQRINYYWLQIANCKIAFNIGRMLDSYLSKFKDRLTEDDKSNLHEIVSNISSDSFKLSNLNDTEYVIALVFLKHSNPVLYKEEEKELLTRLDNCDGTDPCVKKLIEIHYQYPIEELNELIYFQFRSFVLIRNTMKVTRDFIEKTIEMLLREDYEEDWISIFANKMVSHVIVPFIAYSQKNRDNVEVDDKELLKWLLLFSEKSFGHKVNPNKWENIYEEDFEITWKFVRAHTSKNERKSFYNYLIDNGFEFHLTDPHSESCFKGVTST